jgi:hypothetical protein
MADSVPEQSQWRGGARLPATSGNATLGRVWLALRLPTGQGHGQDEFVMVALAPGPKGLVRRRRRPHSEAVQLPQQQPRLR